MTKKPILERLRLQPDRRLTFFQQFLRNPQQIGSVIPSSRFLESRLVGIAGVAGAQMVVELGPGTGGTTRALLRAMPQDCTLLAIESNAEFARGLAAESDERLLVHPGGAQDLLQVLERRGLPRPQVVLSGIPFSTIPPALGQQILRDVWSALAPGGQFVAYQVRSHVAELGEAIFGMPEKCFELLNVPPMRVFRWRKPALEQDSPLAL